jgi:predicted component of type VI protein secretion system
MGGKSCGALAAMNMPDMPDGMTPLVRALLARAPQMNFFQLCQLLERLMPQGMGLGARDTPAGETVRFRPYPKVGFPGTELAAVEFDHERPRSATHDPDHLPWTVRRECGDAAASDR